VNKADTLLCSKWRRLTNGNVVCVISIFSVTDWARLYEVFTYVLSGDFLGYVAASKGSSSIIV